MQLADCGYQRGQLPQIVHCAIAISLFGRLIVLQFPCQVVRNIHTPAPGLDHRTDIRAQGISRHQGAFCPVALPGENICVDCGRFVADDLDPVKKIAKPRLRQLAFLIQQIAFGDQQDTVRSGDILKRFAGMRQQLNRVLQHVLSRCDQFCDHRGRNALIGHFYRGFDHRKDKALDAEPIMTKVSSLGRDEAVHQVVAGHVILQKIGESLLRQPKEPLVLPQRIVGIECDCRQISGLACRQPDPAPFSAGTGRLYRQVTNRHVNHAARETMQHLLKMSGPQDGDDGGDTSVIVETKPKTKRPPLYKVLLLNDDYTPMEFVVAVLERFFGMSHAQAFEIMLTVHKKGVAVVGVFSHEIAETKVAQVMDFARRHQHPLQCTMEKE